MILLHQDLTDKIIKAFYNVYNELGYGFLERVYEKALLIELAKLGVIAVQQHRIKVFYKGQEVGDYFADIVAGNPASVILEIKAAEALHPDHEKQLQNYLKATGVEVGLLLNFGPKPQFSRRIFMNKLGEVGLERG